MLVVCQLMYTATQQVVLSLIIVCLLSDWFSADAQDV